MINRHLNWEVSVGFIFPECNTFVRERKISDFVIPTRPLPIALALFLVLSCPPCRIHPDGVSFDELYSLTQSSWPLLLFLPSFSCGCLKSRQIGVVCDIQLSVCDIPLSVVICVSVKYEATQLLFEGNELWVTHGI